MGELPFLDKLVCFVPLHYLLANFPLLFKSTPVDSMSAHKMEVDTAHSTPLYHRGRPENWLWAQQSLREEHRGYEGLLLERGEEDGRMKT